MAGLWRAVLFFITLNFNVLLAHTFHTDESSGGICSNQMEAQSYLTEIASKCFKINLPYHFDDWRLCGDEGEDFTCKHLHKYVSVIPSCGHCEALDEIDKAECFRRQLFSADCSIKKMLIPALTKSYTCVRHKSYCVLNEPSVAFDAMTPVETPTSAASPTTRSEEMEGVAEHYGSRHKPCKKCDQCEPCEEKEKATAAMSVPAGVGLFFAGLILGALMSCCICLFVPAFRRRSTNMLEDKVLNKFNFLGTRSSQQSEHQNSNAAISPSAPPEPETSPVPVANTSPDTYHDLNRRSAADSHTYTGLHSQTSETSTYIDPATSDTYDAPHDQINHSPSVNSPTYQIPQDDISFETAGAMSGTRANQVPSASQGQENQRDTNRAVNEYSTLTHDVNRTSNEYNALVQDDMDQRHGGINENGAQMDSDNTDHQYFVLESQNGERINPSSSQQQNQETDNYNSANHNYFVLEKQK